MSFADLEERSNAAVMRRLSNARALQVGASEDFPVIFDRAYIEAQNGVGGTKPVATALDSAISGFASHSTQLAISGTADGAGDDTYRIVDIQPDGTGMSLLVLEVAQ